MSDREPVAYLCDYAGGEVIRVGLQCTDDQPIYEGDTVVTETTYTTIPGPGANPQTTGLRIIAHRTSRIERGEA